MARETTSELGFDASLVTTARASWLVAAKHAAELASDLFQPGSGYGDPDARQSDIHRLESARAEAERCFREYHDLDRQYSECQMLKLQRSQNLATWASFAVAFAVGIATIVQVAFALIK